MNVQVKLIIQTLKCFFFVNKGKVEVKKNLKHLTAIKLLYELNKHFSPMLFIVIRTS